MSAAATSAQPVNITMPVTTKQETVQETIKQEVPQQTVAEDKHTESGAPLRLMAQFLRAVTENRMENALALAQTILKYEPRNKIMLDYQETLAQYVNNERELAAADGGSDGSSSKSSLGSSTSTTELSTGPESEGSSSTGQSGHEDPKHEITPGGLVHDFDAEADAVQDTLKRSAEKRREEERLGSILRDLRERRAIASMEALSRWDEHKFAASSREVETVLWNYLPEGIQQAAHKRAKSNSTSSHDSK